MIIKSIELYNLRSFKQLRLGLSKSINLLIGNNNSGKSSIIKAIYKLQNLHALGEKDIRKLTKGSRINIQIEDINEKEGETFTLNKPSVTFPDTDQATVIFSNATHYIETKKGADHYYFNSKLSHRFDENGKIFLENESMYNEALLEFHGLPTAENNRNFIYPFFAKRKSSYNNQNIGLKESYHVSEDLSNITAKIQKISNGSHPKSKDFHRQVEDILGFSIGVIPAGDNNNSTVGIYVDNSSIIGIENMGEGVVNILGLIVTLLTEDRKLYLIEEIENDIHPKALKKLLNLILEKASNNQFVISTHSNIVLKYLGIQETKIFYIQWNPFEEKGLDQIPTSSVREIENNPNEKIKLLEELGYDLFDFDIYSYYFIFEESSAEHLFKKFLIPEFFPMISAKIKTIAASGAADINARFSDFLRLFVFIHSSPVYFAKAWVFADGDTAGLEHMKKLRMAFNSWPQDHFLNFTKQNIEDYYPTRFQNSLNALNNINDNKNKREKKIELNTEVFKWINDNKVQAKNEFEISAKELIEMLGRIERNILE